MKIGDYEFPNKCPKDCRFLGGPFSQGDFCSRCPIFNCSGECPLLRPEDYRKDWAKSWYRWFEGGMQGTPRLPLIQEERERDELTF